MYTQVVGLSGWSPEVLTETREIKCRMHVYEAELFARIFWY